MTAKSFQRCSRARLVSGVSISRSAGITRVDEAHERDLLTLLKHQLRRTVGQATAERPADEHVRAVRLHLADSRKILAHTLFQ